MKHKYILLKSDTMALGDAPRIFLLESDGNKNAFSEVSAFSMVQEVWCEDTQAVREVWVFLPCSS